MNEPREEGRTTRTRAAVVAGVAAFLLAWNALTALYANPFTLTQWYDGVQYQLLARNRLAGHDEVGDTSHTVGREGRHPMWRPGLVWVEQGLGAVLGSVQTAAALASALGTTLLELALLWLAWLCFGGRAALVVLAAILVPWPVGPWFLGLALGQGPEPWAAAGIVLGLAALIEAVRRRSWTWALAAGLAAGTAEWFRTGTVLLFAVPCLVLGAVYLGQRNWKRLGLAGAALACLLVMSSVAGWVVPSPVNKTVANLWHNFAENDGPLLTEEVDDKGPVTFSMGGYRLAPGTMETYNDYIVRRARTLSGREFVARHAGTLFPLYFERLQAALLSGAWGLRWMVGGWTLALFLFQVVFSLVRRDATALPAVALAAGALAYYFGPVVLLRGDQPSHYLLLALPLFLAVAARGAVNAGELGAALYRRLLPVSTAWLSIRRGPVLAILLTPVIFLTVHHYLGVLAILRDYQQQGRQEQAAVDTLPLAGKTVACRNMSWFVDRDVRTILLPYATVAELAHYTRAHDIDGILVWDHETQLYFRATPYGSLAAFDRAMRKCPTFDTPQVAGAWRWYPVRRRQLSEGQP